MANIDNPHGLRPLMRRMGGGMSDLVLYHKAVAYSSAIFRWDPVTRLAGVLNGPASGITPGTTLYAGVASRYSAASTIEDTAKPGGGLGVIGHPDDLFDVQEDNSGAANAVLAKMGYNANLTGTAGGTPTADNSNVELSGTSIATTGTLDVRINRLVEDPTNAYGAWARLEVKFNKHLFNVGVTAT